VVVAVRKVLAIAPVVFFLLISGFVSAYEF